MLEKFLGRDLKLNKIRHPARSGMPVLLVRLIAIDLEVSTVSPDFLALSKKLFFYQTTKGLNLVVRYAVGFDFNGVRVVVVEVCFVKADCLLSRKSDQVHRVLVIHKSYLLSDFITIYIISCFNYNHKCKGIEGKK